MHHGRLDLDASIPVFRELARQFGVKLGKRENGLFGRDFGSGHPEKMAAPTSNVLWRLRHNTAWAWRGRSGGPESCVCSIKQAAREEADHGGILRRSSNEFQMRLANAVRRPEIFGA
jgi:hypothetical protein